MLTKASRRTLKVPRFGGLLLLAIGIAFGDAAQGAAEMAGVQTVAPDQPIVIRPLLITKVDFLDPTPPTLAAGQTAILRIVLQFQTPDSIAVAREKLGDLLNFVRVSLDNAQRHAAAFVESIKADADQKSSAPSERPDTYTAVVSVSFTVDRSLLDQSLFGLTLAGSHALEISFGLNAVSTNISIEDTLDARLLFWGLVLAGLIVLAALTSVLLRLTSRGQIQAASPQDAPIAERGTSSGSPIASEWTKPTFVPPPAFPDTRIRPVPPPSVPTELTAALSESRAALALGSGASLQAGFPGSSTLLQRLVEEFGDDLQPSVRQSLRQAAEDDALASRLGGFGRIMDALVAAVGGRRERVITAISRELSQEAPDLSFHETLAALPWRTLLSLTWDSFAEDVFKSLSPSGTWKRFTPDDAGELSAAIRNKDRLILKAMGDLERPASVSLSIEEFRRNLAKATDFQRGIGLLLQTQTFLFIGAGADTLEQFLQAVAPESQVDGTRHFALVPDQDINDVWANTLARFGVKLIPYDASDGHGPVEEFVASLHREAGRRDYADRSDGQKPPKPRSSSRITQLKLVNIGPFDSLDVDFSEKPIEATGQLPWTVIFGPNGCGKSCILKAISLVLGGNEAESFPAAGRLLKIGKNDGSIELHLGSETLRTLLYRDRKDVKVKSVQVTQVQAGTALVLGFPSLRGGPSKNPAGPANLPVRDPEPADLLPLLSGEPDKRLENLKQWTINLLSEAGKGNPRFVTQRKLIDAIIRDLVPGKVSGLASLDETNLIGVITPEGNVPFDDVSQGMQSIFNWIGVLTQRLYDIYPQSDRPEQKAAIVLIDEIDAHLHPEWQRTLVELTKNFFPKVQIVATSHSSLLAGALRGEELFVLNRDDDDRVAPVPQKVETFGQRTDAILTSVIFGLRTDRNPEAERLINDYFDLFEKSKRSPEEETRLVELREKLKQLNYGQTIPLVPTSLLDSSEQDLTPEQVAALRRHFAPDHKQQPNDAQIPS
jgi:predicted ATP-binding protein involved in virulence